MDGDGEEGGGWGWGVGCKCFFLVWLGLDAFLRLKFWFMVFFLKTFVVRVSKWRYKMQLQRYYPFALEDCLA